VIELLITITLFSLVIGIGSVAYIFGQQQLVKWRGNVDIQNKLHVIGERITKDILQADQVISLADSAVTLQINGKLLTYAGSSGEIFKDSLGVLNDPSIVAELKFLQPNETPVTGNIIKFNLSVSGSGKTLSAIHTVHIRQPAYWSPIGE